MKKIILGLDLGTDSIGWSLITQNESGKFDGIIDAGSRIFESAIEYDEKNGKASTKAADRRAKRQVRRSLARHRKRMKKLRHYLQKHNLLVPEENFAANIIELDKKTIENLKRKNLANLPDLLVLPHVMPFYLRAMALDYNLSREELGRAIYHLGQRRGFKTNRKVDKVDDKDTGKMKVGIKSLEEEILNTNSRTLGELFAQINPQEHRIRERYTSRAMYEHEFKLICERQKALITDKMQKELFEIIFYQRPLKSSKHLLGCCEFENNAKRCSYNQIVAQEFRLYQNVNNLVLINSNREQRRLTSEERNIIISILDGNNGALKDNGKITYAQLRKSLKLAKDMKFSIELNDEKEMSGNVINNRLTTILGSKWQQMSDDEQEKLLHTFRCFSDDDAFVKHLKKYYIFSDEEINQLNEFKLPDDYCNLSKKAINKLLPFLKEGLSYSEAVAKVYPNIFSHDTSECYDELPSFVELKELKQIPNPGVKRILKELRYIINAIIKKYGKPDLVRIELARELKNSEKQRNEIIKDNSAQEKAREAAYNKIIHDATLGITQPRNGDIEKVLLAEECDWICPYTGKSISLSNLLKNSEFDIEHIIPYSRSLDNSFANKTLCHHHENRHIKKNYTPFEAYQYDEAKYNDIIARVKKFKGNEKKIQSKLRRFQLKSIEDLAGFSARALNDTKIASKYAMKYLGLLYGGVYDSNGKIRVQASTGKISSLLRNVLELNSVLGGDQKNRGDHRHHAIDATVIAMSDNSVIQMVANYFSDENAAFKSSRFWNNLREAIKLEDWESYYEDIQNVIDKILVSHHISKRVRGSMHEETIYGKNRPDKNNNGKPTNKYQRKPLASLSIDNIEDIVDNSVRKAVLAKLDELDSTDPKIFKNEANLPYIVSKDGKTKIPIKNAKIKINLETTTIGSGDRAREVKLGNNHHMEIVDIINENGEIIKQEGYVVSMFEAYQRVKNHQDVICKIFPDITIKGKKCKQKYRMSLFRGDVIYTKENDDSEGFRIINCIPQSKQVSYINLAEARPQIEYKADKKLYTARPNTISSKLKGKYLITPLGEERRNNA